jgi:hypothetical protein
MDRVEVPRPKECTVSFAAPIVELRQRREVFREIETLDPETDDLRIAQLLLGRVFCDAFFHQALLAIVDWRTFGVATISPVLGRRGRGDMLADIKKRDADTLLFFALMHRDGYRSETGKATIARLSAIHKTFDIPPGDYTYVTGVLSFEVGRILERLGLPGLSDREERAMYGVWAGISREWGIEVPETAEELRSFYRGYEWTHYGPTEEGPLLARSVEQNFLNSWVPRPLHGLGAGVLRSMVDDRLLDLLELPRPSQRMRRLTSTLIGGYLRGRRIVPGPVREDNMIRPWSGEYGDDVDPRTVGPRWAATIQAPGCPYLAERSTA